eukprot:5486070-Alexandrium_andersonii.AAC.1
MRRYIARAAAPHRSWAAARTLLALPLASPERPPRGAPCRRGGASPAASSTQLPLGLWYGGMWVAGATLPGLWHRRPVAVAPGRVGAHLWVYARRFSAGYCGARAPLRVVARSAPICHYARPLLRHTIGYTFAACSGVGVGGVARQPRMRTTHRAPLSRRTFGVAAFTRGVVATRVLLVR